MSDNVIDTRREITGGHSSVDAESVADTERALIAVRGVGAVLVLAAVFLLRDSFPGAVPVMAGAVLFLIYNTLVVIPLYMRSPIAARNVGMFLDTITIAGASLAVAARERAADVQTDIWLIVIVLVVATVLRFGPRVGLSLGLFWCSWLVLFSLVSGATWGDAAIRSVTVVIVGGAVFSVTDKLRRREELVAEGKRGLEAQNRETFLMLATVVEARDETTGQHLRHVETSATLLAQAVGLSEREAKELGEAAVMHDVGKAGVPDKILMKPGPLEAAEWDVVKRHTVLGEKILGDREAFTLARQIARSHHERWDGSGYPDGLRGEDIPLAARITAVVDMYDALRSERPYKPPWSPGEAFAELERAKGTQLDPALVDAFLALLARGDVQNYPGSERKAA